MNTIEVISKEDMNELRAEVAEIKQILLEKYEPSKKWLNGKEFAKQAGISPNTVRNLWYKGLISSTKIGGNRYFNYEKYIRSMEEKSR